MDMALGSQWVLLFAEGDSFRMIYAAKHFRFFENGFIYVCFLQLYVEYHGKIYLNLIALIQ